MSCLAYVILLGYLSTGVAKIEGWERPENEASCCPHSQASATAFRCLQFVLWRRPGNKSSYL